MRVPNEEVRNAAKKAGIRLWEVAGRYGLNDGNFSRKLRKELSQGEKEKLLAIIDQLDREKKGVS